MTKFDELIRRGMDENGQQALRETEPLGYFKLGLSQFTGPFGWVTWLIMAVQIALFAVGVWCAVHFFAATDVLAAVKWGISGGVLILMALNVKLSLMPQMQADRVIREVRRLQVIVASRPE